MPAGGIGTPHKCFRKNGCKICNPDFHKKSKGYTQSKAFKNQQVSLELSAASCDHNYCRICTKHVECPSRLGVSECQGFLRLITGSKHISEHNQTLWISSSGPLCIQTLPSSSTICSMEARIKQHSSRCNATVLEQNVSICFPTFQFDKSNPEKVQNRKLMLAAWKFTGNLLRRKEFQAMQTSLYPSQEDLVLL